MMFEVVPLMNHEKMTTKKTSIKVAYPERLQIAQGTCGNFRCHSVYISICLDPRMIQRVNCGNALLWISFQKTRNKIFCFFTNIGPFWFIKREFAEQHCLNNFLICLAVKWRVAAQQDVENHSTAPQVALMVIRFLEDFWCDIVWCSILLMHLFAWYERSCRAEVDNCDACLLS